MAEQVAIGAGIVYGTLSLSVLTGIFFRLGGVNRAISDHDRRLSKLEE